MFSRQKDPPKAPPWCSGITREGQALLLVDPGTTGLDYGRCSLLRRCVDWAVCAKGDVIADLSRTEYLDCSGLGLLLSMSKEIGVQGRQLVLVAPSGETVHAVLYPTGLVGIFDLAETLEEAAQKLLHPTPAP